MAKVLLPPLRPHSSSKISSSSFVSSFSFCTASIFAVPHMGHSSARNVLVLLKSRFSRSMCSILAERLGVLPRIILTASATSTAPTIESMGGMYALYAARGHRVLIKGWKHAIVACGLFWQTVNACPDVQLQLL